MRKITFKELFIINNTWSSESELTIRIPDGMTSMSAKEAALFYGSYIVLHFHENDITLDVPKKGE